MSLGENSFALTYEFALPRGKAAVQGNKEFEKSRRKVALWIEVLWCGVDRKTVQLVH